MAALWNGSQPMPYTVSVGKITVPPPNTTCATSSATRAADTVRASMTLLTPRRIALLDTHAHAGTERDARERIVGDNDRNAADFGQQFVQTAQQRAAAGENHAAIDDVRRQLGRRFFEHGLDRFHDRADRLGERFANLFARNFDRFGQTVDEIAPADFHRQLRFQTVRGSDLDLDLFGGSLADHQVVDAPDVPDDRLVHLVARDAKRVLDDDSPQRDHGDVGRTAADVDDHASGRTFDR